MKLFDEIVELLSRDSGSLTDALLKTKVLMHRIGHKELAEWVNDELTGYEKGKPVPPYRVIGGRLVGNLQNAAYSYSNQTLPTAHLPEKLRKSFLENELRDSIRVLEQYAEAEHHLASPIAPEFYAKIGEGLSNVWVQGAWLQMEPTQILHALTDVRSRLLDFVLSLQEKLGEVDEANMKEAGQKLDAGALFQNAFIGDNATFVIGNRNTTTIQNSVKKGDFSSLAKALMEKGVASADVAALQEAINEDGPPKDQQEKFGPAVKGWIKTMCGKAVDAAWNVELGIAAGFLTEALKAYYF